MSDASKIEWTDATWNIVTGCSVVSPACTNCYAMRLAGTRLRHHPSRAGLTVDSKAGPVWTGEVRFNEQWLLQPLQWKRPRKIFVCAHGDLFHENVPDEWIDKIFAVGILAQRHILQILTKRAARMRAYMSDDRTPQRIARRIVDLWIAGHVTPDDDWPVKTIGDIDLPDGLTLHQWPPENFWLGVTAEDQRRLDERRADLERTPAALRWISAEPLLGPLVFVEMDRIDWVICGGESGPAARPMHPDWVRSLRDQCAAAGVPFLFKQWGAWLPVVEEETGDDFIWFPDDGSTPDGTPSSIRFCGVRAPINRAGGTWARVGKASAGRLLDGRAHNEFPKTER